MITALIDTDLIIRNVVYKAVDLCDTPRPKAAEFSLKEFRVALTFERRRSCLIYQIYDPKGYMPVGS